MIKLIIFLVAGYVIIKSLKGAFGSAPQSRMDSGARRQAENDDLMVKDPNCRTYIPKREAIQAHQKGETLYFCSAECRDTYLNSL